MLNEAGFACTFIGLTLDIMGGFILSLDAIGISKVRAWVRSLTTLARDTMNSLKGMHEGDKAALLGIGLGLPVVMGFISVVLRDNAVDGWLAEFLAGVFVFGMPLSVLTIALVTLALVLSSAHLLISFLVWILVEAQLKSAGGIGFAFLTLGFMFQLLAAVIGYLKE